MASPQDTRTLIATFDDYNTARQAAQELENTGVPTEAIHVDSNQKTATAGSTAHETHEHKSGFAGWWSNLFGSDDDDQERRGYEGALQSGNAILRATVPAVSMDAAVDILNRYGAVDVDRRGLGSSAQASSAQASSALDFAQDTSRATTTTGNGGPIEVVEEELQVGKRAVQRGGVRVYSHIVSQPVEEQVQLREEHVRVERRPVDRDISPSDVSALRDQTIEVTEMAEEAIVGKRARVREEVVIGKQATERTETVRDNVRHTEVEVEELTPNTTGSTTGSSNRDYSADYRNNYQTTYGSDTGFEAMQPAYDYGYRNASDPRYQGRSWDQVETNLRSDYETRNPGGSWDKVKNAVRYGWDKVTGNR